jgi:hypothetical protein
LLLFSMDLLLPALLSPFFSHQPRSSFYTSRGYHNDLRFPCRSQWAHMIGECMMTTQHQRLFPPQNSSLCTVTPFHPEVLASPSYQIVGASYTGLVVDLQIITKTQLGIHIRPFLHRSPEGEALHRGPARRSPLCFDPSTLLCPDVLCPSYKVLKEELLQTHPFLGTKRGVMADVSSPGK